MTTVKMFENLYKTMCKDIKKASVELGNEGHDAVKIYKEWTDLYKLDTFIFFIKNYVPNDFYYIDTSNIQCLTLTNIRDYIWREE